MGKDLVRCTWCGTDQLYLEYHDKEWGHPLHNDEKLFEFLILESFQAGLSWITILRKRESFRLAFDNFDAQKIATYKEDKIAELLQNEQIIRNRAKITAVINNAQKYLEIKKEFGSFDKYIWQFVDYKTIHNKWKASAEVPAITEEAEQMSKSLRKRGFKFIGPTTCYAFMQATGMVNDHLVHCYRHKQLR
jgi:DNA-3-methyladenine glycosylase I